MERHTQFLPYHDRYAFDNQLCGQKGYAQVDTNQDASYFGIWAHPTLRKVVTFCEGDVSIVEADNDTEFVEKILSMNRFYDGGIKIDPGFNDELKKSFERLGLSDMLH